MGGRTLVALCCLWAAMQVVAGCVFDTRGVPAGEAGAAPDVRGERPPGGDAGSDADAGAPPLDASSDQPTLPAPREPVTAHGWIVRAPLLDHPQTWLRGIWAAGAGAIWVVGHEGHVLYHDGVRWRRVKHGAGKPRLTAVHGSAPDDVWIVGEKGTALHFDGVALKTTATGTGQTLRAVLALGKGDVWAVGHGGTVLHHDGTGWTQSTLAGGPMMRALWGAAPGDVWAVGGSAIYHHDGSSWTAVSGLPVTVELHGLWGLAGKQEVYAVGDHGTLLRYNGVAWIKLSPPPPTGETLNVIWGRSGSDLWAGGAKGTLLHFDGSTWSASTGQVGADWLTDGVDVGSESWVLGVGGRLYHRGGGGWRRVVLNPGQRLHDVAGEPLWIVGDKGLVLRERHGAFVVEAAAPVGQVELRAVQVGPAAVWVGGMQGIAARHDGSSWTSLPVPGWSHVEALWRSPGATPRQWAVGSGGTERLYRLESGKWVQVAVGGGAEYRGIWGSGAGDVWVVGTKGAARHFDGSVWSTPAATGVKADLHVIWGVSPTAVWAAGGAGTLLRWSGSGWSAQSTPAGKADLHALAGRSAKQVWAAGDKGVVLAHDGVSWVGRKVGTAADLHGLWAGGKRVVVVGEGGVIRQRALP